MQSFRELLVLNNCFKVFEVCYSTQLPHDSKVQVKNSSVTPGRKLPQPYSVKVGEMNVSSHVASGGSSIVASGDSSVPGGAVGIVGKN